MSVGRSSCVIRAWSGSGGRDKEHEGHTCDVRGPPPPRSPHTAGDEKMNLSATLVIYVVIGVGVAVAVYLCGIGRSGVEKGFAIATAVPFWPLYIPLVLARQNAPSEQRDPVPPPSPDDEMAAAIQHIDAELETALASLDGWAPDVLAREKNRLHELRSAWSAQADRIREMDRLLALPEYAEAPAGKEHLGPVPLAALQSCSANQRLRHSQEVRRQNIQRLGQVRRRAYEDLMGTLAWVRELVSMIHLAKFTGAPASRAEELVAEIAAAVEGLSALTWQDEMTTAAVDDNT
jgi:hypothetical protein